MAIRLACPSPQKNEVEKENALGGTAVSRLSFTRNIPETITHAIVPVTTSISQNESLPTVLMSRYASSVTVAHTATATSFAPPPLRLGTKYRMYSAKPTPPLAAESGAVSNVIQTNRKLIIWPMRRGPNASRRYTYDPPAPGIAAPNSAHTAPSHTASSAPTSHPTSACGPPIEPISRGNVMN